MMKELGGLAVAGIAVFGGVSSFGDETTRDDSGAIVEAGGLGAFSIREGDCFNLPTEDMVQSVEAIPCGDAHDVEAFAVVTLPPGEYPGFTAVANRADEVCIEAYEDYVGIGYWDSEFGMSSFTPTQEGWEQIDDREILCFLGDLDGAKLTGSMKGSGR